MTDNERLLTLAATIARIQAEIAAVETERRDQQGELQKALLAGEDAQALAEAVQALIERLNVLHLLMDEANTLAGQLRAAIFRVEMAAGNG